MPRLKHDPDLRALVAVRGHPFDRSAFDAMFQAIPGVSATMVDQPAAALLMCPRVMRDFDVLVLYDMPGIDLAAKASQRYMLPPPRALRDGMRRLLDSGKGVVALHHALAGWPAWDEYADWLGGRFLYRPGRYRGRRVLDSGYRHAVTHEVSVVVDHPVTAGLPPQFTMTDELYLAEVDEAAVTPLLRSSHMFAARNFWSAAAVLDGQMDSNEGWTHPSGSDLIGWTKRARRSPLVYLQPGDGPTAYDDTNYRRLVENALRWAASTDALDWARSG